MNIGSGSGAGALNADVFLSSTTFCAKNPSQNDVDPSDVCRTYGGAVLQSGDTTQLGNWVVWNFTQPGARSTMASIGKVVEVVQISGSNAQRKGLVSFLTIQRAITGEWHSTYGMRQIELLDEFHAVKPQVLSRPMSFLSY